MGFFTNLAASYTSSSLYSASTRGMHEDAFVAIGIIFAYGFLFLFIFALYYVITAILMSALFKKANVKSSTAWIPFYRQYKFLQLGGQNGKLVFLSVGAVAAYFISAILFAVAAGTGSAALIPIPMIFIFLAGAADLVFYIFRVIAAYNLSKKLDKEPVMTVFFVVSEFIWWAIMLADKNTKFNDKNGAKRLDQ